MSGTVNPMNWANYFPSDVYPKATPPNQPFYDQLQRLNMSFPTQASLTMPSPFVSPVTGSFSGQPQTAADQTKLAQALNLMLGMGVGTIGSIRAFHGSPYDFDRFDVSKIGSGEGAQSYGHGLYFAESKPVAQAYQKKLASNPLVDKMLNLYDRHDDPGDASEAVMAHTDYTPTEKAVVDALHSDDWLGFDYPHQAVRAALREPGAFDLSPETQDALSRLKGRTYEVDINANPDHFLDWDKPLGQQHPDVLEKLQTKRPLPAQPTGTIDDKTFSDTLGHFVAPDTHVSQLVRTPQQAQALKDAGIPGVKYFDQGSRRAQEGTRNYVTFSDDIVNILRKYSILGLLGGGAAAAGETQYGGT